MGLALLCLSLLLFSGIFNTVVYYHPNYATNPDLYYPLVILPTLLELCILAVPRLMAKIGLGQRYEAWVEETHGGGATGSLPVSESGSEGKSGKSKESTT